MLHSEKNMLSSKKHLREKGQSLLEFAVSLILLVIILAGIIDLGRMFFYYIAMRDAAQEGIVYGIAYPSNSDCAEIDNRIKALLSDDNARIQVVVLINGVACNAADDDGVYPDDACSGNEIEVSVIDPEFPITMPFLGAILGRNTIALNASVTGTILRPQCPSSP
jgi:hypothetical protein